MSERVSVTLDTGQQFAEWTEIELQFGLDSYSAAALSGPFDHGRDEVRRAFQPLMFPGVTVEIGDELVLTGRMKDVSPSVDADQASIGITVYSLPDALTEICAPPDLWPLEFNGFDLKRIAQRLAGGAAGLSVTLDGPPGARFARCRCDPNAELQGFLADLALQRGFVLSDLPDGGLLFRSEAPAGSPVARLKGQPLGKVTAAFKPESWFAFVHGRASKRAGKAGSKFSQFNSLYRASVPRHHTISVGDTESADVPRAVKSAVGRMVAAVATYTVEDLPSWRDPHGELWRPNTTVTLTAPEAMIYRETELLIRSVKLRQEADTEKATLELVLPGSFGGELPSALPWDL